ncbi:MAG: PHB depolymerase family esterase [Gemmatimonadota bacterium]
MTWARTLLAAAVILSPVQTGRAQSGAAHLEARPSAPTAGAATGLTALGVSAARDAYLYVPSGYRPNHPAPLVVLLHGATQSADLWSRSTTLFALADSMGLVLLMPNSQGRTWDLMLDGFGPDVALLDSALTLVFRRCNIDPKHIALAGFSDGATYALSLGVGNGDLFSSLIAFSPGYLAPAERRGTPRIFIAHGTDDRILPINSTSRRIVPMLKQAGYIVVYHEFEGPHTVRPDQLREALAWLLGT